MTWRRRTHHRQVQIRGLAGPTGDKNPPTSGDIPVAIIWTPPLRSRAKGHGAIFLPFTGQGGDVAQRPETAIFEVHLQSTDFASSQSHPPWAISRSGNPPLLLPVSDLGICLPPPPRCLPYRRGNDIELKRRRYSQIYFAVSAEQRDGGEPRLR